MLVLGSKHAVSLLFMQLCIVQKLDCMHLLVRVDRTGQWPSNSTII